MNCVSSSLLILAFSVWFTEGVAQTEPTTTSAATGIDVVSAEGSLSLPALPALPAANDTLLLDSAAIERAAIQAKLAQEISALTHAALTTETYRWTHLLTVRVDRAGAQQVQQFWSNPDQSGTPSMWRVENDRFEDVFYLDPTSGRTATLNLARMEGSFIPARLAEKAGFTGNSSEFEPKKSKVWTAGETDAEGLYFEQQSEGSTLKLRLSPTKDVGRANAVYAWLQVQPIESLTLPHEARKHPILSLEINEDHGQLTYRMECTGWAALESPIELDGTQLTLSDPERDLRTIAREWTEQKSKD